MTHRGDGSTTWKRSDFTSCTLRRTAASAALVIGLLAQSGVGLAQAAALHLPGSAKQIVAIVVTNENLAALHTDHYAYISHERSERTGGHLWTEKVVETNLGKVRFLLEEDGQPLSLERAAAERRRLAAIVSDPDGFQKRAQALKDDEAHARQMLLLLTKAFLFSDARDEGGYLRIDFKPNPDYQAQSIEERVLHGMNGTMLVEPNAMRLHQIGGQLTQDISIGFGLLATIRAGSNFNTTRDAFGQPDWKTTLVDSDINGKAIFFKAIARKQHAEHSNFVRVSNELTLAQAVALAEQ